MSSRRTALASAITVAIISALALSGCSVVGDVVDTVNNGPKTDAFQIKVGDCFQDPEVSDEEGVSEVRTVECSVEHDYEAYLAVDLPLAAFPGQEEVGTQADDICLAGFFEFIETDENYEGDVSFASYIPSPESWADGDREVLCFVYDTNGRSTGSLKGSGKS